MDPRWRRLHDLAMGQRDHVATRQVEAAGLTRPALHYWVRVGLLDPVARGVHCFTTFPPGEQEREAAVLLWAGADEGVAAAFRHKTALQHYELTDAFQAKLHLSVQRGFCMPGGAPWGRRYLRGWSRWCEGARSRSRGSPGRVSRRDGASHELLDTLTIATRDS